MLVVENKSEEKDINPEYWYKFIDKNANLIESINYGTGENSLSQDWFELIHHIRSKYPNKSSEQDWKNGNNNEYKVRISCFYILI